MVLLEMTPVTYSGEHLPLFATDGNPEGSRTAWTIVFCSWTCSRVRGQQWVSVHRGRKAPTRESLCWHCVWILWTMLSQTQRGWWPNQSPCYWNRTGDYSSWPLWYWPMSDLFFSFFLPSRFLFWVSCLLTRMSWLSSNPSSDWRHPKYLWFESDFLGTS